MKIKHEDLIPNPENPFAQCKLEREPYARVLTEIVSNYADGFVLAINNEWGTGKTTFVKMWRQQLTNAGFQTIYFNAWENDFENKPLVALMSELASITSQENKKIFDSVVKKGAIFMQNIAPALLKSIASRYIKTEEFISLIENAAKSSFDILKEEIDVYTNRKKSIEEFRIELENFIVSANNKKPLVFIIDELDRCRPNYAVEVLEQIKHFFSVKGIVFVLSIDKNQLANAVKGVYGSELIDGEEYLRRFIDLEYSIPKPSVRNFIHYLYDYYSFSDFFAVEIRTNIRDLRIEADTFILMAEYLFLKSNLTLRQQEKVFAFSRLVLCTFQTNSYVFPEILFILVYLKLNNKKLYQQIAANEFSLEELSKVFGELMYAINIKVERLNLIYIEALLLWFYNNNNHPDKRIHLYERDEHGLLKFNVISKFSSLTANFADCFDSIRRQRYNHLDLGILIKKVDLTETLILQQ